jgi:hypothetical protein
MKKYLAPILFGWFLVVGATNPTSIPTKYDSLRDCQQASAIMMKNYNESSSGSNVYIWFWNCIPDQDGLKDKS